MSTFLVRYINDVFEFEYSAAAVLSFFLALAIWPVGNLFTSRDSAAIRVAKDNGELKGVLISEAIGTGRPVEVSLDTGKVYIGQIIQSGIGMNSQFDLMIVPSLSGYRDRETNQLTITHSYLRVLVEKYQDWQDLKVGLSLSNVVLVRYFDPRLYLKFSNEGAPDE